jgi:hypothetical protein
VARHEFGAVVRGRGINRRPSGSRASRASNETIAAKADGMPMVEVAGLTVVPSERILYAATHGRSMWRLNLD